MRATDDYCLGFLGWLFGHKFQPRYSVEESKQLGGIYDAPLWISAPELPEDAYKRTYHGDVCVRCGKSVNFEQEPTT